MAVLEVTSVRRAMKATIPATTTQLERPLIQPERDSPRTTSRPLAWKAPAIAKPPPIRSRTSQGIFFAVFQSIRKTPVGRLPYGLQKRVELGRALAAEPDLLLLDEPMAGMNAEEKEDMCRFILDVNGEFGTTIVLIEHDMSVVMDISDRVVVLDYGCKIADGSPDEVRANKEVIDAYLGVAHD